MAYNLQPLIQILDQILHPDDYHRYDWHLDPLKKPHIESLLTKARELKGSFENSSPVSSPDVEILEHRIRDAAYLAQNVIESHLADQFFSRKEGEKLWISPPNSLQKIIEEKFEPVFQTMTKIQDKSGGSSSRLVSETKDLNTENIFEGVEEDLNKLKEQLVGQKSQVLIIPIVGTGGIGKTALARLLCKDALVCYYFDSIAWVTIFPSYNMLDILWALLQSLLGTKALMSDYDVSDYDEEVLEEKIYTILCTGDRRYLIVIDDLWSSEVWDRLKIRLPDNRNGSRILVTTRDHSVATYVSAGSPHQMKFLNETDSWNLLCRKVFAERSCPPELEKFGKTITEYCSGLPHAIHVVGKVLQDLDKIQEAWKQVADDVNSFVDANNDQSTIGILSKSYTFLPNHLKPCFLYMGVFPKHWEIKSSQVINLWVAEGFLKPIQSKSFEETAEEYLSELVQKNLLIVCHKQGIKGKVKSYIMHDLVRDFCIRKAREEKFLYDEVDIMKELSQEDMSRVRLNMVHASHHQITRVIHDVAVAGAGISSVLHSFNTPSSHYDGELPCLSESELQFLRVLNILGVNLQILPKAVKKLFFLRYLAASISSYSNVASSISDLCYLQTLILHKHQFDGSSVWKRQKFGKIHWLFQMSQLRHIKFKGNYPLFALEVGEKTVACQENLQTLSTVAIDDSFPRILKAMPNLKKLGILTRNLTSRNFYFPVDLRELSKLEILKCSGESETLPLSHVNWPQFIFPASLKKLTINNYVIPHWCLNGIGCLPNLEVLKLQRCEFEGAGDWTPIEGEFLNLRLLRLSQINLRKWAAADIHYPRLEHLVIHDCENLEEIPGEIGDIPTLQKIEVLGACSPSAVVSVKRIKKEQLDFYENDIQVHIDIYRKDDRETYEPMPPQPPTEVVETNPFLVPDIAYQIISSEKKYVSEITEESNITLEYEAGRILLAEKEKGLQIPTENIQISDPRDSQTDYLQYSSDLGVMVKMSLAGELSIFVDLTVHTMSTSSSKQMLNFGLDPKRDDYLFYGSVTPTLGSGSSFIGGQPSSGPIETCQASVGPMLDSRITIGGSSVSAEMLTPDKWRQACLVTLTDKEHISLPQNPECPNLNLLFLQRSIGIADIPPNFFDHMPALSFVDLSGTLIRALPESLYKKPKLQGLLLKNCIRLVNLSSEIRDQESLQVLDLLGTELHELPDEIGQLSHLRHLKLSFYGPDDEREFAHLPHELVSTNILSKLVELQVLSIEVHPEDHRWKKIAAEITEDLAKLNKLTYLQYYFPTVKSLEWFTSESQSWKEKKLRKFKFIVGNNVKRIGSRVPEEVETMYDKHDCCLRYVNSDVAAKEAIKSALEHTSAFYLDHISKIQSLTEFGISNFKEIKFCVVRECRDIQVLIANDERNESAFAKLEHLGIYYLWGLQQIWKDPESPCNFQRLTHLTVDTCPELCFIVSQAMVECFCNLEELVVQDCKSVKEIIQEKDAGKYGGEVLPKLRKLVLRYLPELVTLGQGLYLSEDQIVTIWRCPKLDLKPQLKSPKRRKERCSSCKII